ncbi:hypothetical protein LTR93_011335 [Exophiala xenobiotica]|nr:hypothetical protein LTR93_011335 [Exophiala xenobiotica]
MAPFAVNSEVMVNGFEGHCHGVTNHHEKVQFDKRLTPKRYEVKGTNSYSKILFLGCRPPYRWDVLIKGEWDALRHNPAVRIVDGKGRTLMTGLGDAHTHFSWNNGDLGKLDDVGVEEHKLLSARSAQTYLDSGGARRSELIETLLKATQTTFHVFQELRELVQYPILQHTTQAILQGRKTNATSR